MGVAISTKTTGVGVGIGIGASVGIGTGTEVEIGLGTKVGIGCGAFVGDGFGLGTSLGNSGVEVGSVSLSNRAHAPSSSKKESSTTTVKDSGDLSHNFISPMNTSSGSALNIRVVLGKPILPSAFYPQTKKLIYQ